ncbi:MULTISPECIES: replication protein [Thermoactinomyces]|uniref:Replication protein n=1 Tax=Thermoactinomyces daqus TaxID=1329516 RepID=A0A7W1XB83_9BACL|nr:replication protein [Thermoactinomyces daqus]MBA4543424.1 replication protein [Thermoactinomyces daqus]MBH8606017.1 replication protein [Thermoactinomyces sp. CICC 10521]
MANPQPDKFTRLSNELYEAIMTTDFSKRQRNILDLVLRLSYGCGKKDALIKPSEFELVGVRKGHVKKELTYLAQSKVLFIDGDRIQINKNYDQWRVSLVSCFNPEKFKDLIKRNLDAKSVTKTVTTDESELSKQEPDSYQNSNSVVTETVTDMASHPYSHKAYDDPKDILKKIKESNNNNSADEPLPDPFEEELTDEQKLENEIEDYYQSKRGKYGFPVSPKDRDLIKKAIHEEKFTRDEMFQGITLAFSQSENINSFNYCLKVMRTEREKRMKVQQKKKVVPLNRRTDTDELPMVLRPEFQQQQNQLSPEEAEARVKALKEKIKQLNKKVPKVGEK